MTTVRLTVEMEQKLNLLARLRNKSKTDLIKEALELFISQQESEEDGFTVGKAVFGRYGSGERDRSVTYKQRIKSKLNAKRHTH